MSPTTTPPSLKFKVLGFWLSLTSIISMVFIHVYLVLRHIKLKVGVHLGESLCNFSEKMNCDAAAASAYSEFLGIPIALWGAITSLALGIILVCYRWHLLGDSKVASLRVLYFWGSLFTAAVSLLMLFISFSLLSVWCPFCIAIYILSFVNLFAMFLVVSIKDLKNLFPLKPIFSATLIVVVLTFFIHSILMSRYSGRELVDFANTQIDEWKANPEITLNTIEPLVLGASKESAQMTIVEFADFRCPHCKSAFPIVKAFANSHSEKVRLEFQAYPLDGECNSAISQSFGTSCYLAYSAHCAGIQGKGWQAHEWIFKYQDQMRSLAVVKEKAVQMSTELNLDQESFNQCIASETTKKTIQAQAQLGTDSNIKGTPTLFVNGRLLPGGQTLIVLKKALETAK